MSNIDKDIKKLSDQLFNIKLIKELYPDVKKMTDVWGHIFWCSSSVNKHVTDVDLAHSCGCCEEAPLFARCYLIIPNTNIKIYANPYEIYVGDRWYSGGDDFTYTWDNDLRKHNIPECVIQLVDQYRLGNMPDCYDYDEDN
jgi:hypothetical protein